LKREGVSKTKITQRKKKKRRPGRGLVYRKACTGTEKRGNRAWRHVGGGGNGLGVSVEIGTNGAIERHRDFKDSGNADVPRFPLSGWRVLICESILTEKGKIMLRVNLATN